MRPFPPQTSRFVSLSGLLDSRSDYIRLVVIARLCEVDSNLALTPFPSQPVHMLAPQSAPPHRDPNDPAKKLPAEFRRHLPKSVV